MFVQVLKEFEKNKGKLIYRYSMLFVINILSVMDVKNIFGVLILLLFQSSVKAQFALCDRQAYITSVGGSITVNHPATSGSCRYKIFAPADTFIQATCSITSSCGSQVFYVSRNGELDLRDNTTWCGTGSVPIQKATANEIVVALDARGTLTSKFSCQFSSVKLDNTNCDCGWSVSTKIVGGIPTKVNGYVSHGALIDKATKDLFCGVSLSRIKY